MKRLLFIGIILFPFLCNAQKYRNPVGKEFPVVAWYSLDENHNDYHNYRILSNAGFNLSLSFFASYKHAIVGLESNKRTGVKLIPCCMDMKDKAEVFATIVRQKKGMGLFYVFDEPSGSDFDVVAQKVESYRQYDDNHMSYINLLPNYATKEQLGFSSYEEYLEEYIRIVKPDFISFDYYPFFRGILRSSFYNNLETVRIIGTKYDIPFWGFIRTGVTKDYLEPCEGELRFQAFSNLAYGAKGIQYFTYSSPRGYESALLDSAYNKTPNFYVVKKLNRDIQKIAKITLEAELEYVWHFHDSNHEEKKYGIEFQPLETNKEGFLCSLFSKSGRRFLMIVNKCYNINQCLSIKSGKRIKKYFGNFTRVKGGLYNMELAPGDCVVIQI